MATMSASTVDTYDPSLDSMTAEQGRLPAFLSQGTSSLESDKVAQSLNWKSPLDLSSAKESFLAFCTALLQFNADADDDEERIAVDVCKTALFVTRSAYASLPNKWRKPRIASDGDGGARLTWKSGGKELRAVFPSDTDRVPYLYKEEGEDHSMIPNFTSATLRDQFDWLMQEHAN